MTTQNNLYRALLTVISAALASCDNAPSSVNSSFNQKYSAQSTKNSKAQIIKRSTPDGVIGDLTKMADDLGDFTKIADDLEDLAEKVFDGTDKFGNTTKKIANMVGTAVDTIVGTTEEET